MLLGGAVAGQGAIDIYLLIAIAWFCGLGGDTTSFFIGRRLGREFVLANGPRFGISHERFEQVEDYFARHGGKTIFIGRFIGLVRAFAPFIAGSSGMRYRAFVPYSILGTGLWVGARHPARLLLLAQHRHAPSSTPATAPSCSATLIVVVVGVVALRRHLAGRGEPARRGRAGWSGTRATRWSSCSAAASGPQLAASSGTGSRRAAPSGSSSPR